MSDPALGTLLRVPRLSLSSYLKFRGSSVYRKLVFRSDISPTVTEWSSTVLTSRAFSLDSTPFFVIPRYLLTSCFVAWVFYAYRLRGHWPPQAWASSCLPLALVQMPDLETEPLEKEPPRHSPGAKVWAFIGSLCGLQVLCGTRATPPAVFCSFPRLGSFLAPRAPVSWLPCLAQSPSW